MQNKIIVLFFIYIVSSLSALTDDYCTTQIQNLLQSLEGNEFQVWKYGLLSISVQMILPLISLLLMIWFLFANTENPFQFLKKHFAQLIIENLRTWGFVLFAGLFFIFPAFIVYFLYLFVPFVVALNKEYSEGKIDALQFSRQLVFRQIYKTISISLLTLVILPLVSSGLFADWNSFIEHPLAAIPLHTIDIGIQFLAVYLLGKLFIQSENKFIGEQNATTYV